MESPVMAEMRGLNGTPVMQAPGGTFARVSANGKEVEDEDDAFGASEHGREFDE